jgi:hypothetical protein
MPEMPEERPRFEELVCQNPRAAYTKYGKTIRIKSPSPSAISSTRTRSNYSTSAGNSPLRFAATLQHWPARTKTPTFPM